jgi:hypothetical protein
MNFKLNFCETAHTKETEEINTQLICHFSTKKLIVFSNGNAKISENTSQSNTQEEEARAAQNKIHRKINHSVINSGDMSPGPKTFGCKKLTQKKKLNIMKNHPHTFCLM